MAKSVNPVINGFTLFIYEGVNKMINEPSASELLDKAENRYELSNAIAKRARQLVAGDEALIKTKEHSPVTIASLEFKEEKVKIVKENNVNN